MRIWIIAVVSVLLGAAIGLGWTVAELGLWPRGSDQIAWGNPPEPKSSLPIPVAGPAGTADVPETEYDFKKMDSNGVGHHDFIIRNSGKGTLDLEKGPTSCSCTVAEIDHTSLAPGESAKVQVQWRPRSHGSFRQTATVRTNDPTKPTIELTVSGELVASYLVEPMHLVFTGITSDASLTRQISIYSFASDTLALTTPEVIDRSMAKFFDLKVLPMPAEQLKQQDGAKSGSILELTLKPGLPAGAFEQRIRFQLSLTDHPEVEVVAEGTVAGPIDVAGPKWDAERGILMLGPIRSGEGVKARLYLMIRGTAQKQVDLKLGEVQPDTLKVELGPIEHLTPATSRAVVTIEVPKGSRTVNHLGSQTGGLARIYIDTGLAEPKQLRLLVHYAVEE